MQFQRRGFLLAVAGVAPGWGAARPAILLRSRDEQGARERREEFDARHSALILCDMWDRHWCQGANARVAALIGRTNELVGQARAGGVTVIHAPSETMEFYRDAPGRRSVLALPVAAPPPSKEMSAPPLPIDDSSGGCDTAGDKFYKAWSRQHAGIVVRPEDFISDKGEEVYSILKLRGIRRLFVMGVHANMCILNRTFAIKQMTRWGVDCRLVRDMTDAMYDPRDRPQVSHEQGTQLVIEYIERYWCPSTTSGELLKALG
jgi:nicotinamidase-related amidase